MDGTGGDMPGSAPTLRAHWDQMSPSEWEEFAKAWLAELRAPSPVGESVVQETAELDVNAYVILMNFSADPERQWQFIRCAVAHAESDDDLGHIAAGPVEHLLNRHGKDFLARVEAEAAADATFARMLTGVWKWDTTDDEVWARVQAIQSTVSDVLGPEREG
jgi:hypothetical protein